MWLQKRAALVSRYLEQTQVHLGAGTICHGANAVCDQLDEFPSNRVTQPDINRERGSNLLTRVAPHASSDDVRLGGIVVLVSILLAVAEPQARSGTRA